VLENSYVRAYYVEVAPHESTLYHHHDLPYFGVLLTGPALNAPATSSTTPSQEPRVIYSPGEVSHTVNNPADVPFTNVTVALLRPQGKPRNRCREVIQGQPLEECDMPAAGQAANPKHYAVFETGEILVEYWEVAPGVSSSISVPDESDALVLALDGASVTGWGGIDSKNAARGGVLWIPAGFHPTIKSSSADRPGHCFVITFKEPAASAH